MFDVALLGGCAARAHCSVEREAGLAVEVDRAADDAARHLAARFSMAWS